MNISELTRESHDIAQEHGFWDGPRDRGMLIALIHSELSEMLEAYRKDPPAPSEHCPSITCVAEEMADVLIRIGDMAEAEEIDLNEAVVTKMSYNRGREYKHGKKF